MGQALELDPFFVLVDEMFEKAKFTVSLVVFYFLRHNKWCGFYQLGRVSTLPVFF